MKLRVSWGQVGNQNIDNYQYLAPIKMTNVHYFYGISGNSTAVEASALGTNWGAYPSRLSNEALTWETSEQTNIGFDARFFASRLGVNFDFYIKSTKDWLLQAPILNTTGTGAPYINGGDVKNTGVELALTWNDNIGKDFSYNISLNGAFNKNKVGKIPTEDGIIMVVVTNCITMLLSFTVPRMENLSVISGDIRLLEYSRMKEKSKNGVLRVMAFFRLTLNPVMYVM